MHIFVHKKGIDLSVVLLVLGNNGMRIKHVNLLCFGHIFVVLKEFKNNKMHFLINLYTRELSHVPIKCFSCFLCKSIFPTFTGMQNSHERDA